MAKHEILTAAEELALARAAQAGAEGARTELVRCNMAYIVARVNEHLPRLRIPREDAIQEGVLGFLDGVRKFDPARGTRLTTCAMWWIRNRLQRASHDYMRIRVTLRRGRDGEPECSLPETRARALAARKCAAFSEVAASSGGRGGGRAWSPGFEPRAAAPNDGLDATVEVDRLQGWLDGLNPREREVLARRFGLDGGEEATLIEVGRAIGGVTRERVRQIERKALGKLRTCAGVA